MPYGRLRCQGHLAPSWKGEKKEATLPQNLCWARLRKHCLILTSQQPTMCNCYDSPFNRAETEGYRLWEENVQSNAKGVTEHGELAGSGRGPADDTSCIQAKGSEPTFTEPLSEFCAWHCVGGLQRQISKLKFRKEKVASQGSHSWLCRAHVKHSSALLEVLVIWGKQIHTRLKAAVMEI